jgi:hypothetical protein
MEDICTLAKTIKKPAETKQAQPSVRFFCEQRERVLLMFALLL